MRADEVALFWRFIAGSLDRLAGCLDGLDEAGLNWRPPAPGANSLYALATHTLGNAEENLLGTLCGRPAGRDREAELRAVATSAEPLRARWRELRGRIEDARAQLPLSTLDAARVRPRRGAILIIVARHAIEHLGQAEL